MARNHSSDASLGCFKAMKASPIWEWAIALVAYVSFAAPKCFLASSKRFSVKQSFPIAI
ncbi:hypothetical protein D3C72_1974760 [compost metagenome]